jgi:uncharacterized protein YjbI with pentapeptide repeats
MTTAPAHLPASNENPGEQPKSGKNRLTKISSFLKIFPYTAAFISSVIFGSEIAQRRDQVIFESWSVLTQFQQQAVKEANASSPPTCPAPPQSNIPTKAAEKLIKAGFSISHTNLSHLNLRGASLQNANFTGAKMICANLEYAKLQGSNFQDADLTGASLKDAELGKSLDQFPGVKLCNTTNIDGKILNNQKDCKK